MERDFWENLRASTEAQVHLSDEPGVRLHGCPMDGWLVTRDAPALEPDWYKTWPVSVADKLPRGRYRVGESGTSAEWVGIDG